MIGADRLTGTLPRSAFVYVIDVESTSRRRVDALFPACALRKRQFSYVKSGALDDCSGQGNTAKAIHAHGWGETIRTSF